MRIASVEGKDWKQALLMYVAPYRATPHRTTGKSQAVLLFGRKIRTKIPVVGEMVTDHDLEVRDLDAKRKGAAKYYADSRRNAKQSDIMPGDKVLV